MIKSMRYKSFSLTNFRGISDEVKIDVVDFSKIISIIGNNESGKTTILQGIEYIGYLCKGNILTNGKLKRALPEKQNSGFITVDTVFKCEILLSSSDIDLLDNKTLKSVISNASNTIECVFVYSFASSTPNGNSKSININGTSYKDSDIGNLFDVIQDNIQDVVYLDDFKFEIPDEIVFMDNDSVEKISKDDLYKLNSKENRMWQDILNDILLASLSDNDLKREKIWSVQDDIVDFNQEGFNDIPRDRVRSMSNHLNELLKTWKDMKNENDISFDKFVISMSDSYIRRFTISIEAQKREFTLSERSRGFQWFVCFVLFTQIRLHRDKNGTIFLLDEPASNLHILPQMDTLQRMQEMCNNGKNKDIGIIYTTHSPFLVSMNEDNKNYSYTAQNNKVNELEEPKISCYKTCEYDETKHQHSSILTSLYSAVYQGAIQEVQSTAPNDGKKEKFLTLNKLKDMTQIESNIANIIKPFFKPFTDNSK